MRRRLSKKLSTYKRDPQVFVDNFIEMFKDIHDKGQWLYYIPTGRYIQKIEKVEGAKRPVICLVFVPKFPEDRNFRVYHKLSKFSFLTAFRITPPNQERTIFSKYLNEI